MEQTSRTQDLASLRTQLREQRAELEKEASNSAARAEESVRLQAELNRVKVLIFKVTMNEEICEI